MCDCTCWVHVPNKPADRLVLVLVPLDDGEDDGSGSDTLLNQPQLQAVHSTSTIVGVGVVVEVVVVVVVCSLVNRVSYSCTVYSAEGAPFFLLISVFICTHLTRGKKGLRTNQNKERVKRHESSSDRATEQPLVTSIAGEAGRTEDGWYSQ